MVKKIAILVIEIDDEKNDIDTTDQFEEWALKSLLKSNQENGKEILGVTAYSEPNHFFEKQKSGQTPYCKI